MTSSETLGEYLVEGEYAVLPISGSGENCTIEGWFIWMSGYSPLFATTNGEWAFIYGRDGQSVYHVGDERLTPISVESVQDHWIYLRGGESRV